MQSCQIALDICFNTFDQKSWVEAVLFIFLFPQKQNRVDVNPIHLTIKYFKITE